MSGTHAHGGRAHRHADAGLHAHDAASGDAVPVPPPRSIAAGVLEIDTMLGGWERVTAGYLIEGPRTTDWLAKGVVKHHRTLGTTLNLLIRSGFQVEHVEEFCPSDEQIAMRPELAEELDRPMFLLVRGRRSTMLKSA